MELTPKQQTTELIRQAEKILLVSGREPSNDQLASMVALQAALTKMGKQVNAVMTDKLPKARNVINTNKIVQNLDGIRDFVISLDMANTTVDKLKYNVEGNRLDITITPANGNFSAQDAKFSYGAYQFDLVIALGVYNLSKMDRLHEQNPTIFDGIHLINVDYHRVNDSFGSVNLIDTNATSVCEILVSLIESLEQGLIDIDIATALLVGIMAATNRFTTPNTSPKSMTVAAQLLASGAKQQEIVKVLYSGSNDQDAKKADVKKKSTRSLDPKTSNLKNRTLSPNPAKVQDRSKAELAQSPKSRTILQANSPLEAVSAQLVKEA